MRNLNTGNAYHEFRTARAAMRAAGQPLQAGRLAAHLHRYSQRGEEYVTENQQIIHSPSMTALAQARLGEIAPAPAATLTATTDLQHSGG